MYQAEALVGLDRIADAISHLNPDAVLDISNQPPAGTDSTEKLEKTQDSEPPSEARGLGAWQPRDLSRARAVMQYNLATAHAVRGEHEKALDHLSKTSKTMGLPLPAQMYFLKIYLELMEGRRKVAHKIISEHFGHIMPT